MQRIIMEVDEGAGGREAVRLAARFDVALCASRVRRPGAEAQARPGFFARGRMLRRRALF